MTKSIAWMCRAVWVTFLSIGITGCGGGPEDPKRVNQRIAAGLQAGDFVTLSNDRLGPEHRHEPVRLYLTRAALDTAIELAETQDREGIRAQAARGETFQIPPGTRAVVVNPDPLNLVAEVRIQGGEHAGRSGWVPIPQIQP